MMPTIRHQDSGVYVVIAKLLTGYIKVNEKVSDIDSYVKVNGLYDADFVAYVVSWQGNHGCTADGIIGPDTWTAIAKAAPTCSTSRNRTSGYTLALQLALGGNLTPDAIYGPRTKAAVATYQDANKLSVDGICGPKTWNALIVGEAKPKPEPGHFVQPKDFKQYSEPWGPKMYSNHGDKHQTMSNSGCGPTADADVVATLIDPSVDPWTLAQLSLDMGDRTYDQGTKWTLFKPHTAEAYGFQKVVQTANMDVAKACLDAGGYVVCSMSPGYWTKHGHFICAWAYDDEYMYANDPASSSRKKQKTNEFKAQCKQYFCFYPDPQIKTVLDTEPKENANERKTTNSLVTRGEKIVDISKWQGDIDFDALKADVALVIVRASCGSDEDVMFRTYARAMVERGIPFGVYGYSYAGDIAKAKDEARKLVGYASAYSPLFYVIDAEEAKLTGETIATYAKELRALGVEKLGCYVAHNHYRDYCYDSLRDRFDFTWIPRYGVNNGTVEGSKKPDCPCDLWQYTSTGKADGISGRVDLNIITGEGKDLGWFLGR